MNYDMGNFAINQIRNVFWGDKTTEKKYLKMQFLQECEVVLLGIEQNNCTLMKSKFAVIQVIYTCAY